MRHADIEIGCRYIARVSGKMMVVRVDDIGVREPNAYRKGGRWYAVTNERTGRKLTFRSAQKFRRPAREAGE